jgi:hypothetical protein
VTRSERWRESPIGESLVAIAVLGYQPFGDGLMANLRAGRYRRFIHRRENQNENLLWQKTCAAEGQRVTSLPFQFRPPTADAAF